MNCFSFADGHAEPHRWQWLGPANAGILNCPYAQLVAGYDWGSGGQDVDWLWLRDRSATRQ